MRKEARHTQMRDRASGVHPDILEHFPPKKNQSLPTVLLYALTCDFTGGCPPPPSRSLCQRVHLQLQFLKLAHALHRPLDVEEVHLTLGAAPVARRRRAGPRARHRAPLAAASREAAANLEQADVPLLASPVVGHRGHEP